jgi:hypothetical protein
MKTDPDIRYNVNHKRLKEIYAEYPSQKRTAPYQIRQDELNHQIKPRLFWNSSVSGTYRIATE